MLRVDLVLVCHPTCQVRRRDVVGIGMLEVRALLPRFLDLRARVRVEPRRDAADGGRELVEAGDAIRVDELILR